MYVIGIQIFSTLFRLRSMLITFGYIALYFMILVVTLETVQRVLFGTFGNPNPPVRSDKTNQFLNYWDSVIGGFQGEN